MNTPVREGETIEGPYPVLKCSKRRISALQSRAAGISMKSNEESWACRLNTRCRCTSFQSTPRAPWPSWGRCREHLGPHGDGLAAQWTFKEVVEEGYWGCLMSVFKAILALACFGPTLTAIFPALETTYVNFALWQSAAWSRRHPLPSRRHWDYLCVVHWRSRLKTRGCAPAPFPRRGAFARFALIESILLTLVMGVCYEAAGMPALGALDDDHTN